MFARRCQGKRRAWQKGSDDGAPRPRRARVRAGAVPDRDRGPARGDGVAGRRARRRRRVRTADRAGGQAHRGGHRAHGRLQRIGARPDAARPQGSELVVDVVNQGDLEATVHWHGLRLENRYDGTHETQAPIPVGGSFSYRISFPDPGAYWYHPHIREDYGQELGQYGNILVDAAESDYWPRVHRELLLTLDDVFIEGGEIAPFSPDETTFAAMGRYGNVMLVAGETAPSFAARRNEVVRLYLTNTANTRVFNVALPGAPMKLVGGDSGRVEREEIVESVVLAPSERVVVDVLFGEPGQTSFEHRMPNHTYTLGTFDVATEPATPPLADEFAVLRANPEWVAERQRLEAYVDAAPDKTV